MIGAFRWLYGRLTEKLYREWSGLYDTVSAVVSLGRWDAWRRRALAYTSGGDVLELGFGTGHLLAAMAGAGRRGVGADVSPAMAARAARRLRSQGAPATVVQAHAQALPFGEGSFDTVVSTFPAAYILEQETLQEAARVLRSAAEGWRGRAIGCRRAVERHDVSAAARGVCAVLRVTGLGRADVVCAGVARRGVCAGDCGRMGRGVFGRGDGCGAAGEVGARDGGCVIVGVGGLGRRLRVLLWR